MREYLLADHIANCVARQLKMPGNHIMFKYMLDQQLELYIELSLIEENFQSPFKSIYVKKKIPATIYISYLCLR